MSQQHTEPGNSTLMPLTAISPLDGRYHAKSQPLAEYASEAALMRYRAQVEIAWLQCLVIKLRKITSCASETSP